MKTDHISTVTHIHIPPDRLFERTDNPYDIFGQRTTEVLTIADMITEIDLDAAAFLYDRAVRECEEGTMTIDQIVDMLQSSHEQLVTLSESGVLRTFAA